MPPSSPERPARRSNARTSGERKNVRGEATRQLILTAAERLFAERGISAVPLRDIGIEAGQRNHAAVQYHFGERDEVVRAIMEFRGAESEASRTDMVADLMLGGRKPTVVDVVSAFVRPLAIHIKPENHYLAFLSLYITEEGGYEGLGEVRTGASVTTLQALLRRLTPQIPQAVLDERWWTTLTSAVHALARYQSAQQKRAHLPATIDVLIEDLVAFLSAGLTAPLAEGDPRAATTG
ncbi:TetR/AcrR family transcriptional regulator [Actinospica durhamensis]|uniref:TetR/AcrR family transcriptional regulator n=1 Tax=Actinospica durhamensis TaxID=1508375 RepID=A0A941ELK7_9ACTN|nr:TetR/AcrR family transcriptional regulator [Actinospica durhamensis]MBR7833123.1 TetR/AcrR family transcriptional regulator [Actinospica durhamensis]